MSLETVPLAPDRDRALELLPSAPGVAQILSADGRPLLTARPANIRRWVATQLGVGRAKPKPGRRPPVDLSPIAAASAYRVTTSPFGQRLAYERLMGHVPLSARKDLKPPAYVHLDPEERFPRPKVVAAAEPGGFGPFRDRRRAEEAVARLQKLFGLRPCDYVFEPDPALPLGLGCLFAQVRSCAAPCLARVSGSDYRAAAAEGARWLTDPQARGGDSGVPDIVTVAFGRAVVVEPGRDGLELYPVARATVLEEASVVVGADALAAAVERLAWPEPAAPGRDEQWLCAWLYERRRSGAYLSVDGIPVSVLAAHLQAVVETSTVTGPA